MNKWSARTAPPDLAEGKRLLKFEKNTYEADKSLKRILESAGDPLAKPIYGRPVNTAALLGKAATNTGATFTAQMQPLIHPGEQLELYFNCENLVQMWVVKMFGQPKSLKSPTPYVLVKELNEHGNWVEVGRTEAVSNECNPLFSRPVIVTYRGPNVQQQIQVNVVSYAFKMRDGMQLGDCTILLDDLVHARTARVLKQPLLSPDHTRANGYVIINASRHDPRESGMWVQLDLSAQHIPWITPSGEKTTDAQKGSLPNVFFEVWQQSSEGEKQVFKSETTSRNRDPDWWPIALQGRKLGGDAEHDSCIWIRFWNQRRSNDPSEAIPPNWIGECRLNLRELITGRAVPILDKWPDTSYNRLLPAEKGQPQLLIQDCKWVKLSTNAKLECEPKYKQDMDFLKDLMENVDLDAATMESCLSCYHFVESRAKVWAMRNILKDSEKFDAPPHVQANTEDPLGSSRGALDAPTPLQAIAEKKSRVSVPVSRQESPAFHAQDYDTAHHHLVEHTPVTRRRQSMMWRNELQKLQQRCSSRTECETSPVNRWTKVRTAIGAMREFKKSAAAKTPVGLMEGMAVFTDKTQAEAPEGSDARMSSSGAPGVPRGESASSTSLTQSRFGSNPETRPSSDMTSFCGVVSEHESLEGRSLLATNLRELLSFQESLSQQNAAKAKAPVPRLQLGSHALSGKDQTERPQSAHALSGNYPQEQKRRPSTARARASGSEEAGACGGRQQWWPSSARARPLSARPVSARSLATSVSEGWGGTSATTPAAATLQFRESIRPLLANVMRQGSETQHPSQVRPVSVSRLTTTGKFRFTDRHM